MRSIQAKLLVCISIFAVVFCCYTLYTAYRNTHRQITESTRQQARLALKFDKAIRKYVGSEIRPRFAELVDEQTFIPETMSTSFVARSVFEDVKQTFPDFILKFSSDNPRNPLNHAGEEEMSIIDYFKENPDFDEWVGQIDLGGQPHYGYFSANRIKESCLKCHGQPQDAPASLVERYGETAGFGRVAGQVAAMDAIAIPLDTAEAQLDATFVKIAASFIIATLALFAAVIITLRLLVTRRLAVMSDHFGQIAHLADPSAITTLPARGRDEISRLTGNFNLLADKLRKTYENLELQVSGRTAELTEANDDLKRERDFSDAVVSTVGALVIVLDTQGNVISFNRACQQCSGYPSEQVLGKPFWHLLPEADRPLVERIVSDLETTGLPNQCENEWLTRDGQKRLIAWSNTTLKDDDGKVAFIIGTGIDITEQRKAETDLQQAKEQAEAANAAKSEFLANMSHEIRTPMTAILGFSDMLEEQGISAEQRNQCVSTIRENGHHLLNVINDILDLSKVEAGKFVITPASTCLFDLVDDVTWMMQSRAKDKGIDFRLQYQYPAPGRIMTDPTRLRQILINLLGNAVKFTEQGRIDLVITYDRQTPGADALKFEIVDTGIGMTDEQMGKLFQPFAQADSSSARKFGGTGLGLAISKRLANMLGGNITVSSTPGQGSRFTVTINPGEIDSIYIFDRMPEENCEDRSPDPPPPAPEQMTGRILLAEDGPDNQRLIQFLLNKSGLEVDIADNGQIACDKIAQSGDSTAYGLILMDMQMPLMDGYEATRHLRNTGYTRPIIALTAHAMTGDREKCLDAGCDDFLTKPIDRQKLLNTIARYLVPPSDTEAAA